VSDTVDLRKPEEIARLRHFLLTALNSIIGYADVVRRRAREQGARDAAELMREAAATGRESVEILRHLLPVNSHISEAALPMLRSSLTPLMERLEKAVASFEESTADACAAEVNKMRTALQDLAEFVRGAGRTPPVPPATPRVQPFEAPARRKFEMLTAPIVYEMTAASAESSADTATAREIFRVFILDDDEDVRATITSLLESAGITATAAGRADFHRLQNEPFDAVLVDLPLFEDLRVIPGGAAAPAIVLVAPDRSRLVVQAIENGADDFITKPVDPVVLRTRVHGVVRRRRAEARAALAGAIAEDVQGLLESIVADASLVLAALPESGPQGEVLARIARTGGRAAELMRQLRSASRPNR
jgi:CheY-like chemotaxis protein